MVNCKKIGLGYSCMALLPGKKHEGYRELELKPVMDRGGLLDSVHVNDITIESKEFQMSRVTNISCKVDLIGKTLRCK